MSLPDSPLFNHKVNGVPSDLQAALEILAPKIIEDDSGGQYINVEIRFMLTLKTPHYSGVDYSLRKPNQQGYCIPFVQ